MSEARWDRAGACALLGVATVTAMAACSARLRPDGVLRRDAPAPSMLGLRWGRDTAAERAAAGASLRGVRAVSARVAWASGSGGTVLRTSDGGRTWRRVGPRAPQAPGADSLDFRSVWAFDSLRAVVASAGDGAEGKARIYHTADGGRSWRLALEDRTAGVFLDAVAFWGDRRHGLALSDPVGGRFVVFATDDGGLTWRRTPAEGMPAVLPGEAAFAAGNAALAVAGTVHAWFVTGGPQGARVWRTGTGGARWDVVAAPVTPRGASAGLFAVTFRDTLSGVALGGDYQVARAGGGQVVVSRDGGVTWRRGDEAMAAPGYWSGVTHVPGAAERAALVAVGGAGTALSVDDGRTWAVLDTTTLHAVSFAGPRAGWAVGPRGRVLRAVLAPDG